MKISEVKNCMSILLDRGIIPPLCTQKPYKYSEKRVLAKIDHLTEQTNQKYIDAFIGVYMLKNVRTSELDEVTKHQIYYLTQKLRNVKWTKFVSAKSITNIRALLFYDLMSDEVVSFMKDHGWGNDTICEVYRKTIISYAYHANNERILIDIAKICLQLMDDDRLNLNLHDGGINKNFMKKESYPWNFLYDIGIKIEECFDVKSNISDELTEIITENLKLTPEEVQCIKLKYIDMLTFREIGKNIGATATTASQIILKVLYKKRALRLGLIRRLLWLNTPNRSKFLTNLLSGEKNICNALNLTVEDIFYTGYFSVRTYNCLKRAGINTVRDIVLMTEDDLKSIRNLGELTFNEIVSVIEDMGLHLGCNYDGEED